MSNLSEAIIQAIQHDRNAAERWKHTRTSITKRFGISDCKADDILGFVEASTAEPDLRLACQGWLDEIDPEWRTTVGFELVLRARLEAFECRRRAVRLVIQYLQCSEWQAHSILLFLTAGAQGAPFYAITRRWARTLGIDWHELVLATTGYILDPNGFKQAGETLRDLLERKGLSDEEFAVRAKVDVETVQEIKHGIVTPMLQEIRNFAEALEMQFDELLADLLGK